MEDKEFVEVGFKERVEKDDNGEDKCGIRQGEHRKRPLHKVGVSAEETAVSSEG